MKKYSSNSNSHSRSRSNNRYFNQKRRSDSSVSPDNSKHSKRYTSSCSLGYTKSKRCSNSPSEHLSSRYKYSNSSSNSNLSYNQPTTSVTSDYDRKTDQQNSKFTAQYNISVKSKMKTEVKTEVKTESVDEAVNCIKKNILKSEMKTEVKPEENTESVDEAANCIKKNILKSEVKTEVNTESVDEDANWINRNIYDVLKRENLIEEINQEGFGFKPFKSLTEKNPNDEETPECMSQLNENMINALSDEEKSTFLIYKPEDILHGQYKLLTKQERRKMWAKYLFETLDQSE